MASQITYKKTESVKIELTQGDLENALRVYLSARLDVPEDAKFKYYGYTYTDTDQMVVQSLTIEWSEEPADVVEEID